MLSNPKPNPAVGVQDTQHPPLSAHDSPGGRKLPEKEARPPCPSTHRTTLLALLTYGACLCPEQIEGGNPLGVLCLFQEAPQHLHQDTNSPGGDHHLPAGLHNL